MNLSPKAVRFVVAALDHFLQEHDLRLLEAELSDDDRSDLENDRRFLKALRQDFSEELPQLANGVEGERKLRDAIVA